MNKFFHQFIYKAICATILFIYCASTSGCLFAGSVAAVTTGTVIAQEKFAGSSVDDAVVMSKIKSDFAQKAFGNLFSILINVLLVTNFPCIRR